MRSRLTAVLSETSSTVPTTCACCPTSLSWPGAEVPGCAAKGVETREELSVLESLQPSLYQGFFFPRPVPPRRLTRRGCSRQVCWHGAARWGRVRVPPAKGACAPGAGATILGKTEDAISPVRRPTYELCYLNPAAQRMFGIRNYRGKTAIRPLRGTSTPL